MRTLRSFCFLAAVGVAASRSLGGQSQRPNERPALVVLIAVDQLRPDYLDRFHDQFQGGFRLVRDSAAFFVNGHQEHAMTETAPGHSAMLSGREPVHTGIFSNDRGVPDSSVAVLEAPGIVGASPRRFIGTTLYDWMHDADSATRVLSVSRKDRGAILPVGRARTNVYWFANGRFTTSTYYANALPDWVQRFDGGIDGSTIPRTWHLLLPESAYAEPDSMPWEHDGADYTFPHSFRRAPRRGSRNSRTRHGWTRSRSPLRCAACARWPSASAARLICCRSRCPPPTRSATRTGQTRASCTIISSDSTAGSADSSIR